MKTSTVTISSSNSPLSSRSHNKLLLILCVAVAAGLNHARVIGPANLSISDALLPLLLISLAARRLLRIPRGPLLFILIVLSFGVASGAFLSPIKYDYNPTATGVGGGVVKQTALFLYLILGYCLASAGLLRQFFRVFAGAAVVVSAIGVAITVYPVGGIRQIMYYGDYRLQGFFDDPNYYALITVCALTAWVTDEHISKVWRVGGSAVLVAGVIASGSKSGTVALVVVILYLFVRWFTSGSDTKLAASNKFLVVGATTIGALLFYWLFERVIARFVVGSFGFGRISLLFTDFESAINDQGSGRGVTWSTAAEIASENAFTGIGFGAYPSVAQRVDGHTALAHNTYLQLGADWGVLLTAVFFAGVVALMVIVGRSASLFSPAATAWNFALALLVGSFAISLDNVRIFWLVIGALIWFSSSHKPVFGSSTKGSYRESWESSR